MFFLIKQINLKLVHTIFINFIIISKYFMRFYQTSKNISGFNRFHWGLKITRNYLKVKNNQ